MRVMRTLLLASILFITVSISACFAAEGKLIGNIAKSQTNSVLLAAVSGKKIRVTGLAMVAGATATDVTFRSKPSGAGTEITPLFAIAANGALVLPHNADGWFETVAGEALTVTTGNGATTGILVTYELR